MPHAVRRDAPARRLSPRLPLVGEERARVVDTIKAAIHELDARKRLAADRRLYPTI